MQTKRLTPDDWLTAGFDALQRLGPSALAAEPLARQLGTTKGSFYWHFKDVPAFHTALLYHWRKTSLAGLAQLTDQADRADQNLRRFGKNLLNDPVEGSLRVWAFSNAEVTEILRDVDMERLAYIKTLLHHLGLGNVDFAHALLATLVGLPQALPDSPAQQKAAFDTLVDTILALT